MTGRASREKGALRFKVGDRVRIVKAAAFPRLIGRELSIWHVGPWEPEEDQPNGLRAGWACDYILDDGMDGLACRDENLEPA